MMEEEDNPEFIPDDVDDEEIEKLKVLFRCCLLYITYITYEKYSCRRGRYPPEKPKA